MMLLDAREGLTEQDMHLLSFIITAGKAIVIAINKWDGLAEEHKEHVPAELIHGSMAFVHFAKVVLFHCMVVVYRLLFKDMRRLIATAMQSLSTPQLTRLLQDVVTQHTPPTVNNRRIKLRYAHAGGHNPPIIVIHGNQLDALPDSYKRYLAKAFVSHLGLIGTPLKLEFKGSENPFKGKKNKLTTRQIKKRKRLIQRVKK